MVARSVVTLGVSTERGTVHAVALTDEGKLPDRVLIQRSLRIGGDGRSDLARAVEAVLELLSDEIGPDREIGGAAVVYRDPAERRTIVTGLADGPWRAASMVSAKTAHLALARAMTWADEFDHLVVCEVAPGYQTFTLVAPERDRVLASHTTTSATVSKETIRPAATAAWDQFDAAGVRPAAAVLIGSAASLPAVATVLSSGFGAPLVPCQIATVATAAGAALVVEVAEEAEAVPEQSGRTRRTAALFAAASVLAGGLVGGGFYVTANHSRSVTASRQVDTRVAADIQRVPAAVPLPRPESGPAPEVSPPSGDAIADPDSSAAPDLVTVDPATVSWGSPSEGQRLGVRGSDTAPSDSEAAKAPDKPQPQTDSAASAPAQAAPGPGAPAPATSAPMNPATAPNGALLFPGESAPPQFGTADFDHWWDNHWHLVMQWVSGMTTPRT